METGSCEQMTQPLLTNPEKSINSSMPRPNHELLDPGVPFEVFDPFDDETRILSIHPLKPSIFKRCTVLVLFSLTLFPLLLMYWKVSLRRWVLYSYCSLTDATHLYISSASSTEKHQIISLKKFRFRPDGDSSESTLHFDYRFIRYIFSGGIFKPLRFECHLPYPQIFKRYASGLKSQEQIQQGLELYGKCCVQVPMIPIPVLMIQEILSPFFVFQIYSIILWFCDQYELYAGAILVVTSVSLIIELIEMRTNLINLRKLSFYECEIQVKREKLEKVSSLQLVPGDIIKVPEGIKMPCDAVLISGGAVVNESMLTGESIPVIKAALLASEEDHVYDPENDKNHTLFSGTEVIQTKNYSNTGVFALVTKTGFLTTKGGLVRSILFPKESKFKFHQDSNRFLLVLFAFAIVGIIITIGRNIQQGIDATDIILRSLDVFTITVPPALPAAMTIGVIFAISRLKRQKIYCISPNRVNMAGRIESFVFDKTGTLTEDGLRTKGFRQSIQYLASQIDQNEKSALADRNFNRTAFFTDFKTSPTEICSLKDTQKDMKKFAQRWATSENRSVEGLACCHGLATIDGEKLVGDPLDIEMFNFINWQLIEPGSERNREVENSLLTSTSKDTTRSKQPNPIYSESEEDEKFPEQAKGSDEVQQDSLVPIQVRPKDIEEGHPYSLAILKRFDFESGLQRMSVLVKDNYSGQLRIFSKGSPEKIRSLCVHRSLPTNFHQILELYTERGYRVLALAYRDLPKHEDYLNAMRMKRDEVESGLVFLGFLVMENQLKPITASILQKLENAQIKTVMATGDNALTAISVAKDCGMITPNQSVYLGEYLKQESRVIWRDVHHQESELDILKIQSETSVIATKKQDTIISRFDRQKLTEERKFNDSSQEQNKKTLRLAQNIDREMLLKSLPWVTSRQKEFSVAMTGDAFGHILHSAKENPLDATTIHALRLILKRAIVYARMTPENKMQLVEALQDENQMVGMCGDGANDCSALKQADVGISLSQAEASIAAPFTSKVPDISCVVNLLREGRAALVTSIQCFKYIAMYSMIQFFSVTLLYWIGSNLSDWQYLYIDLIILLPISVTMGYTAAYSKLTHHQPTGALISVSVLTSIVGHVILEGCIQLALFLILQEQSWFFPLVPTPDQDNNYHCYENSTIFLVSNGMYLSSVLVFSIGKPFRKAFYTNIWFLLSVVILYLFSLYLIIWPDSFMKDNFKLMDLKMYWKLILLGISVVYLIIAFLYEKCVVEAVTRWHRKRKLIKKKKAELALLGRNF